VKGEEHGQFFFSVISGWEMEEIGTPHTIVLQ